MVIAIAVSNEVRVSQVICPARGCPQSFNQQSHGFPRPRNRLIQTPRQPESWLAGCVSSSSGACLNRSDLTRDQTLAESAVCLLGPHRSASQVVKSNDRP